MNKKLTLKGDKKALDGCSSLTANSSVLNFDVKCSATLPVESSRQSLYYGENVGITASKNATRIEFSNCHSNFPVLKRILDQHTATLPVESSRQSLYYGENVAITAPINAQKTEISNCRAELQVLKKLPDQCTLQDVSAISTIEISGVHSSKVINWSTNTSIYPQLYGSIEYLEESADEHEILVLLEDFVSDIQERFVEIFKTFLDIIRFKRNGDKYLGEALRARTEVLPRINIHRKSTILLC
ncbi:MAG: hypothetical protein ACYS8W_15380 [Planctomycetota bacterium]|jgi:hypothetical protein